MAHAVKGLIAKPGMLEMFACKHSLHSPVALLAELAILPLRDVDLDIFLQRPFSGDPEGVCFLSAELMDELRSASRGGELMYFETEYFGGQGAQAAAVFQDGSLVFGPESADFGPINVALRLLGVRVTPPAVDEFDTVNLGRHRHTDDWLKLGRRHQSDRAQTYAWHRNAGAGHASTVLLVAPLTVPGAAPLLGLSRRSPRAAARTAHGTERPLSVRHRTSATEGRTDVHAGHHQCVLMTLTGL